MLLVFPHTKADSCAISRAEPWPAGSKLKPECDPRKFVGAAGARDHGSRQRDGIPDPLQQQRDRVNGREAFAAIAIACRRIDARQDRRVMPVSGGRSARNDIAVTDGRVVWPCGAPPPAVRWVADPSDGLLAPASIGCWSGGPKKASARSQMQQASGTGRRESCCYSVRGGTRPASIWNWFLSAG